LNSEDYPVNSFFSVIENPEIYISENGNYITNTQHTNKTVITLHIAILKSSLNNMENTVKYINDIFGLEISIY